MTSETHTLKTSDSISDAPDVNKQTQPLPHDFRKGPQVSPCGGFYRAHKTGDWLPRERPNPFDTQKSFARASHEIDSLGPLKSRALYIVLGLLLGGLGIHNFYVGRVGMGAAQLLTTLLIGWTILPLVVVALWVLIEVCVVNTDGYKRRMV